MKIFLLSILLFFFNASFAQDTLEALLKKYNNETIPYITVEDVNTKLNQIVILDSREPEEYEVSHIKNAIHVGYQKFSVDTFLLKKIPKNRTVVVYCSLGVRSEDVSEKLKKAGYSSVFNLYGGIFEWKNNGYPVVNLNDQTTEKVHTCSKTWSKWLLKGEKIYSN